MPRLALEIADIFRAHGPTWRTANAAQVSLGQLKVMSAIERCRTAAFGGHVARCEKCANTQIAYNSCRNRHCPKCQGAAAKQWLAERRAELLLVPYFHVVFTLPAAIADIAYPTSGMARTSLVSHKETFVGSASMPGMGSCSSCDLVQFWAIRRAPFRAFPVWLHGERLC